LRKIPFINDAYVYILRGYTGHLSEGSLVRNVVVHIPKFDAKPNPNPSFNPNHNPNPSPNPYPMPIRFGQMTLRTSELLPFTRYAAK